MPTEAELLELFKNTTQEWIADYNGTGVKGMKFTSKTDTSKYIFIPTAGYGYNGSVIDVGNRSIFWSSSLYASKPIYAWFMYAEENGYGIDNGEEAEFFYDTRFFGHSVRGVRN